MFEHPHLTHSYCPGPFLKEKISLAALLAERLKGGSFEAVTTRNGHQNPTDRECPGKIKGSPGREGACVCPLERAKVPLREDEDPGARIPKPTCCKCFVIEFHKKIKSISESNKALKVFN